MDEADVDEAIYEAGVDEARLDGGEASVDEKLQKSFSRFFDAVVCC